MSLRYIGADVALVVLVDVVALSEVLLVVVLVVVAVVAGEGAVVVAVMEEASAWGDPVDGLPHAATAGRITPTRETETSRGVKRIMARDSPSSTARNGGRDCRF